MRRKNSINQTDLEDLKRQNNHLEAQIRALDKAKSVGNFSSAKEILSDQELMQAETENLGPNSNDLGNSSDGSARSSVAPGQSLLKLTSPDNVGPLNNVDPPRKKMRSINEWIRKYYGRGMNRIQATPIKLYSAMLPASLSFYQKLPTTTATYFFHDEMFPKCFLGSLFCIKQVLWWLWKKYKIKYNNNTIIAIRILDLVDQTTNKVFNLKEFLSPVYSLFSLDFVWEHLFIRILLAQTDPDYFVKDATGTFVVNLRGKEMLLDQVTVAIR